MRTVIAFLLGVFFAIGLSYADFHISPEAPIHTMSRDLLKMNLNGLVEAGSNLIERCYNKAGKFDSKTCEPALEEFKIHMHSTSENLYCSQC